MIHNVICYSSMVLKAQTIYPECPMLEDDRKKHMFKELDDVHPSAVLDDILDLYNMVLMGKHPERVSILSQ